MNNIKNRNDSNIWLEQVSNNNYEVRYNLSSGVGGFEFNIDNATPIVTTAATGSNFSISHNSNGFVLGHSINNTPLSSSTDGLMVSLTLDGSSVPTGLSGIVILKSDGTIYPNISDYVYGLSGCMDSTADNYDSSAVTDDGSCVNGVGYDSTYDSVAGGTGDPHILTFGGNKCELPHNAEIYNFLTTKDLILNVNTYMKGEIALMENIYFKYNKSSFTLNLNSLEVTNEINFNFDIKQIGTLTKEITTDDKKYILIVNSEKNGIIIRSKQNLTQENSSGILMSDDFDECIIDKLQ